MNFLKKFVREILKKNDEPIKKICACCGKEVEAYEPIPQLYIDMAKKFGVTKNTYEMLSIDEYTCPHCQSADRERAYALTIKKLFKPDDNFKVLEIAPRPCITNFIKNNFRVAEYKTGDLFMPDVDYKLDITNMEQIPDKHFDFFICSHVLEHVDDDIKAMKELKRILSPKGCGIAVVPIDLSRTEIDEDPNCTDVEERWRRFGQDDHVRAYSKQGFIERLKTCGFKVKEYDKKIFGERAMIENGLAETSVVYVVA